MHINNSLSYHKPEFAGLQGKVITFPGRPNQVYAAFPDKASFHSAIEKFKEINEWHRVSALENTLEFKQPEILQKLNLCTEVKEFRKKIDSDWICTKLNEQVKLQGGELGWCIDGLGNISIVIRNLFFSNTFVSNYQSYPKGITEKQAKKWVKNLPIDDAMKSDLIASFEGSSHELSLKVTPEFFKNIYNNKVSTFRLLRTLGQGMRTAPSPNKVVFEMVARHIASAFKNADLALQTFSMNKPSDFI